MPYIKHRVHLTKGQLSKLRTASKQRKKVEIDVNPSLAGNFDLYLTKTQINKLNKGKPCRLTLSPTQLSSNGGFLWLLPGIISALAGAAGGISSVVKNVQAHKAEKAAGEEQKRHNVELENLLKTKAALAPVAGTGAYLPKRNAPNVGTGAYLPKRNVPTLGTGACGNGTKREQPLFTISKRPRGRPKGSTKKK